MSLINEALKRTRDAAYQAASGGPTSVGEYRTANEPRRKGLGSGLGVVLLGALVLAVCVGAIVVSSRQLLSPRRKDREQLPPDSTVHRVTVSPPSAPALPASGAQDAQARSSSTQVKDGSSSPAKPAPLDEAAENALVAKLVQKMKTEQTTASKTTEPTAPAPAPPKLTLQGIMSQGNSREAMINGHNVREGDEVEGVRVVAIEGRSVKLRFADQELVLRLP